MGHSALEAELAKMVGIRLQRLRIHRGLPQDQVAHAAGISRTQYQRLESGINNAKTGSPSNPTLASLIGIARVMDLTVPDLLAELLPDRRDTTDPDGGFQT